MTSFVFSLSHSVQLIPAVWLLMLTLSILINIRNILTTDGTSPPGNKKIKTSSSSNQQGSSQYYKYLALHCICIGYDMWWIFSATLGLCARQNATPPKSELPVLQDLNGRFGMLFPCFLPHRRWQRFARATGGIIAKRYVTHLLLDHLGT